MGIKEISFVIFLIITILFPFFFSKKDIIINKEIKLPSISIETGHFKNYEDDNLTKKGLFKNLDYFNDNNYVVDDLKVTFLDKNNSLLYSDKMIYTNVYTFSNPTYITNDYTYSAKKSVYNEQNKLLISYDFRFFNDKIDGRGKYMTYQNNIIKADNIKYYLKGLK